MKRTELYISRESLVKALGLQQEDDIILSNIRENQSGGIELTVFTDDKTNLEYSKVGWTSAVSNQWDFFRRKLELKDVE